LSSPPIAIVAVVLILSCCRPSRRRVFM
jgi:hypothetical protein